MLHIFFIALAFANATRQPVLAVTNQPTVETVDTATL